MRVCHYSSTFTTEKLLETCCKSGSIIINSSFFQRWIIIEAVFLGSLLASLSSILTPLGRWSLHNSRLVFFSFQLRTIPNHPIAQAARTKLFNEAHKLCREPYSSSFISSYWESSLLTDFQHVTNLSVMPFPWLTPARPSTRFPFRKLISLNKFNFYFTFSYRSSTTTVAVHSLLCLLCFNVCLTRLRCTMW